MNSRQRRRELHRLRSLLRRVYPYVLDAHADPDLERPHVDRMAFR